MALDVRDAGRRRDNSLPGSQDGDVARRMMIIAGAALAVLIGIKLGFLNRVLP